MAILKAYLADHYRDPKNTTLKPFNLYLLDEFLNPIVAEAKLLAGDQNELEWCSMIKDPFQVQQLKEKVEISFLECNQERFTSKDNVVLHLNIKNVTNLIIKVSYRCRYI